MEIRNIEDCFKFRLLRKIAPDNDKSKRSLEIAETRLKDSKEVMKFEMFQHVILDAYMTMFHAARALLYRDGIQEKSHFAVYIYLKEKFGNKIPIHILNLLNIYRIERHEAMYGLGYKPNKEEAVRAIKDAEIFLKEIEKVLREVK